MLLPPSPSMRASVTTPAGPKGCPRRSLPPPSSAFPISQVGRPPHCPFRGLLDVHSRSGPHVRRTALCGPLSPGCFRPYRCLHDPPWLLPTGATVVGRVSHPLEEGAFPWRTEKCGLWKRCRQKFKRRAQQGVFWRDRLPRPPTTGNHREALTSLLLYFGLIDKHDRDVIPDGIDPFAPGTFQPVLLWRRAHRFLAEGTNQDLQKIGAKWHRLLLRHSSRQPKPRVCGSFPPKPSSGI